MWQLVSERLIRQGNTWSSRDFSPGPDDYREIAESADSKQVGVVHDNCNIRIFALTPDRRLEFVKNGKIWSESAPRFAASSLAGYLAVVKKLEQPYSLDDAAAELFPFYHRIGEAKRNPDDIKDFTKSEMHPQFNEWEWYDYTAHARDIASTLTHRSKREGWVESAGLGMWRVRD